MKLLLTFFTVCLISLNVGIAQQESEALEGNHALNDRYQILKSKSQNYKEYKVIRENVLDSFWKIIRDSIAAKEKTLVARDQNIKKLNADLAASQAALKAKEESMDAVLFDSTHINVLGINFTKGVFLTTVAVIIGLLVLAVMFITTRLKMVHSTMKERSDAFNALNVEYEEYKRKAMEKQTKLSRELQTERNRFSESRGI